MATRGGWRKPWPTVQMEIHRSRRYYVKLFALSFVLGGLFESLLIATGYYKNNIKTAEDLEKALEKKKAQERIWATLTNTCRGKTR